MLFGAAILNQAVGIICHHINDHAFKETYAIDFAILDDAQPCPTLIRASFSFAFIRAGFGLGLLFIFACDKLLGINGYRIATQILDALPEDKYAGGKDAQSFHLILFLRQQ